MGTVQYKRVAERSCVNMVGDAVVRASGIEHVGGWVGWRFLR